MDRAQHPTFGSRTSYPSDSSTSTAARPTCGSLYVVKQSAYSTTTGEFSAERGLRRFLNHRYNDGANAGMLRCGARLSLRFRYPRAIGTRLNQFAIPGTIDPSRFSVRTFPNTRDDNGGRSWR